MDNAVRTVFLDYDKRFEAETTGRAGVRVTVDDLSLPIGAEAGQLLNLLVKAAKAQHILELGTSNGYSTLWLAEAARAVGGQVTTIEQVDRKRAYALAALTKAGLAERVAFLAGDALDWLERLPGPFDFVLIDLWKDLYVPCLDRLYPKLSPGAMIAADNMIHPTSSRPLAAAYRDAVRAKPKMQSMLLDLGQGIELSRYVGGLPPELV